MALVCPHSATLSHSFLTYDSKLHMLMPYTVCFHKFELLTNCIFTEYLLWASLGEKGHIISYLSKFCEIATFYVYHCQYLIMYFIINAKKVLVLFFLFVLMQLCQNNKLKQMLSSSLFNYRYNDYFSPSVEKLFDQINLQLSHL